jgi:hypothetical protein
VATFYSFTFYNFQTKATQSVTALNWNDAWRQLGIRFGSPFLRGTFQPVGVPVLIGPIAQPPLPSQEEIGQQ